ncbi:hypothetical protein J7L13_01725 [bacterium]|nr:hypothetical protein [bacterium]
MGVIWAQKSRWGARYATPRLKTQTSLMAKLLMISVIAVLSVFYLIQSNVSASKTFLVRELEGKKEDLEAQNERLRYEAERLKSLQQIEEEAEKQGMVPVEKIDARAP